MTDATVTIDRRYRGPRTSANGGYTAGLLGSRLGDAAEVTLRLPPPLERPSTVPRDGERLLLEDGDALVAEAVAGDPGVSAPTPPSPAEAEAAAAGIGAWGRRSSPSASSAARARTAAASASTRARPRPRRARRDDLGCARRRARGRLGGDRLPRRLRCSRSRGGVAVLARMTARIDRLPAEGERCVVVGWPLGEDGRKLHAGTALYGARGDVLAVSRQLWILPR